MLRYFPYITTLDEPYEDIVSDLKIKPVVVNLNNSLYGKFIKDIIKDSLFTSPWIGYELSYKCVTGSDENYFNTGSIKFMDGDDVYFHADITCSVFNKEVMGYNEFTKPIKYRQYIGIGKIERLGSDEPPMTAIFAYYTLDNVVCYVGKLYHQVDVELDEFINTVSIEVDGCNLLDLKSHGEIYEPSHVIPLIREDSCGISFSLHHNEEKEIYGAFHCEPHLGNTSFYCKPVDFVIKGEELHNFLKAIYLDKDKESVVSMISTKVGGTEYDMISTLSVSEDGVPSIKYKLNHPSSVGDYKLHLCYNTDVDDRNLSEIKKIGDKVYIRMHHYDKVYDFVTNTLNYPIGELIMPTFNLVHQPGTPANIRPVTAPVGHIPRRPTPQLTLDGTIRGLVEHIKNPDYDTLLNKVSTPYLDNFIEYLKSDSGAVERDILMSKEIYDNMDEFFVKQYGIIRNKKDDSKPHSFKEYMDYYQLGFIKISTYLRCEDTREETARYLKPYIDLFVDRFYLYLATVERFKS